MSLDDMYNIGFMSLDDMYNMGDDYTEVFTGAYDDMRDSLKYIRENNVEAIAEKYGESISSAEYYKEKITNYDACTDDSTKEERNIQSIFESKKRISREFCLDLLNKSLGKDLEPLLLGDMTKELCESLAYGLESAFEYVTTGFELRDEMYADTFEWRWWDWQCKNNLSIYEFFIDDEYELIHYIYNFGRKGFYEYARLDESSGNHFIEYGLTEEEMVVAINVCWDILKINTENRDSLVSEFLELEEPDEIDRLFFDVEELTGKSWRDLFLKSDWKEYTPSFKNKTNNKQSSLINY